MIGECAHGSRREKGFDDTTPVLNLRRTGERFESKRSAEGIRGTLKIGALLLPTVERGNGYKHLPPGWYDCECGYWTMSTTNAAGRPVTLRVKAIRVLGDYSRGKHKRGRIYIHPGNWPHQTTGCCLVGMHRTTFGVAKSRRAMIEIFNAIGGWEEGKRLRLHVEN